MIDYSLLGDIDLVQVLKRFEHNLMTKFNCAKVATITSFDSSKQQVNVSIDNYPNISGIPLIFPKGQNYSIQLPVNVGDSCIVLFCDTDLDKFKNNEGTAPEYNDDIHGLNGAVALVGISNSATKIDNYSTDSIKIKYKNIELEIKEDSVIVNTDLIVSGNISATNITASGDIKSSGAIEAGNGASGTFSDTGVSASGRTITISKGIITNIS